jgi:hypothetical protein
MKFTTSTILTGLSVLALAACGEPAMEEGTPATEIVEAEPAVVELCDARGTRFATAEAAIASGIAPEDFGATMCPEYKMDPSWDADGDGQNDCYNDGSCSAELDYQAPRKAR